MIYFTGFWNWEKQHGRLISIANGEPPVFKDIERLTFFVPDWKSVQLWKSSLKTDDDWKAFVAAYRILCRERWDAIARWLDKLDPKADSTLLCWEPKSSVCHRMLAAKIVQHYRPDCYGGLDVLNPCRKRVQHAKVEYKIEVADCPWCEGFAFSLTSSGGGIGQIGDRPDYPHLKGVYALPECAIEGAIEFVKRGAIG